MNKLIILFVLFYSFLSFSNEEKGIGNDISQSQEKSNEFKKRDEYLWEFKLKLSSLITSSPNGVFNKVEIKEYIKELDDIKENLGAWEAEALSEKEKLESLGVLLDQNKKIQKEKIKLDKKDKNSVSEAKKIILEIGKDESKVKRLIKTNVKHIKNLSKFRKEKERWEKYLFSVIKKDVGQNLYNWEINNFFLSPVDEIKNTFKQITESLKDEFKAVDRNYIKKNLGKIIFISIALAIVVLGLLFLSDFVFQKNQGSSLVSSFVIRRILNNFYKDRIVISLFLYVSLWPQFLFSLDSESGLFNYLAIFLASIYLPLDPGCSHNI